LIILATLAAACAADATGGKAPQSIGVTSEPLIMGMTYKPRTFGFVLVDIGGGINLTKDEAQKRLFGTNPGDKSVKQYYIEGSYGTQDITGEILGPLSYPMTGCDTRGLASTLKPMLGMYDHYLWYMGSRTSACSFSGLAESGLPSKPQNDTWYNGSANCVVLVQEPGHNFGMMHSSSMTCGTASFADDPDSACMHNEYGDRYDPMGGSCNHMNAWQKVFEGWLQKCNGITVNSSGMYTLQPLEVACDGPQVLKIPMPKVRPFGRAGGGGLPTVENIGFYFLELRTARGFDDTIRSSPTVLVHVAEDFHDRTDRGRHTWILDMDPTTTRTIDGLGMGKSFTDPAGGTSFQVMAITADSATIQVTLPTGTGGPTCLDDTPYDATMPRMCSGLVGPSGTTDAGIGSGAAGAAATMPPPRVNGFILVDADTDKDIRPVEENAVLDLSQLPPNLTLRADTDPPVVGSVKFVVDAGAPRIENMAPYAISTHDASGNLAPWTLALGPHTVSATAASAVNGGGTLGELYQVDFMITRSAPAGLGGVGGSQAGTTGGLVNSGTGVSGNPALDPGLGIAGTIATVPYVRIPDNSGCACRVPGAGVGSARTPRAWVLAAFALGLFIRRRRLRLSGGRRRSQ
jgi:hypothetical protein